MRAGKLDRRVTLERATVIGKDEFGADLLRWDQVATVWAQARPNRGAERFTAAEVNGSAVMSFQIRYRSDVTVKDRLVYEGRVWNIVDVREVGRRVVTEIDATARAE
ncbi:phage head closure protein [Acuticoccus sediminis]|uniref:phage head closure protein n=1 Tax=Acuticoccus sediminis TaxID=2184697 RepID=UPI001CFE53D8|nr:phage head closure protein [Acuticoccus sediminis]